MFFWIESFLTNRTQFVSTNQTNSPLSAVTSSVSQGSILGPLLFLIYIHNLPENSSSSTSLFADDRVIYREITNKSDALATTSHRFRRSFKEVSRRVHDS